MLSRLVDEGTEGFSSDAAIFNESQLKEKIEASSIGLTETDPFSKVVQMLVEHLNKRHDQ